MSIKSLQVLSKHDYKTHTEGQKEREQLHMFFSTNFRFLFVYTVIQNFESSTIEILKVFFIVNTIDIGKNFYLT